VPCTPQASLAARDPRWVRTVCVHERVPGGGCGLGLWSGKTRKVLGREGGSGEFLEERSLISHFQTPRHCSE
jgi:hypothetical protein